MSGFPSTKWGAEVCDRWARSSGSPFFSLILEIQSMDCAAYSSLPPVSLISLPPTGVQSFIGNPSPLAGVAEPSGLQETPSPHLPVERRAWLGPSCEVRNTLLFSARKYLETPRHWGNFWATLGTPRRGVLSFWLPVAAACLLRLSCCLPHRPICYVGCR